MCRCLRRCAPPSCSPVPTRTTATKTTAMATIAGHRDSVRPRMRPLNTARAGSASRALSASVTAGIRTSFRSLRHRNFRLYWWGQLVSLIGTWMQTVAQGWLMYRLSADPFVLSLLAFAQFIPTLLFSLPAGVLADRFDKRKIIILTQGASLLEAAALAALTTSGHATPGSVLVLAFIFGIIT